MRLRDIGERRLISGIRQAVPAKPRGVILGIGDDAAVVRGPGTLVLTHDLLVEDVDFRRAALLVRSFCIRPCRRC